MEFIRSRKPSSSPLRSALFAILLGALSQGCSPQQNTGTDAGSPDQDRIERRIPPEKRPPAKDTREKCLSTLSLDPTCVSPTHEPQPDAGSQVEPPADKVPDTNTSPEPDTKEPSTPDTTTDEPKPTEKPAEKIALPTGSVELPENLLGDGFQFGIKINSNNALKWKASLKVLKDNGRKGAGSLSSYEGKIGENPTLTTGPNGQTVSLTILLLNEGGQSVITKELYYQ